MLAPLNNYITPALKTMYQRKVSDVKPSSVVYKRLSVGELVIEKDRIPARDKIADLAAQWDDNLCKPIVVVLRDGKYHILKGVTRAMAAALHGQNTIDAMIVRPEAANVDEQSTKKPYRTIHRHRDAVNDRTNPDHKTAVELQRLCGVNGIKIAEHQSPGILTGADRAMQAIQWYGSDAVSRAMSIYRKVWSGDRVHAYVLSGLAAWLHRYQGIRHFTDEKIVAALTGVFPSHADAIAMMRTTSSVRRPTDDGYVEVFTRVYNEATSGRGKLPNLSQAA